MDQNVLNALNAAGDALKAALEGRDRIALHFFRDSGQFHVTLPVGVGTVAATGDTPAEAYAEAEKKHATRAAEIDLEAEVRAEIARRLEAQKVAA